MRPAYLNGKLPFTASTVFLPPVLAGAFGKGLNLSKGFVFLPVT